MGSNTVAYSPLGSQIDRAAELADGIVTTSKLADGVVTNVKVNAAAAIAESKIAISITPPIGSVLAWLKSFTNTPGLPSGWVECDGSVLSDAASVYDGQTIPDLNGDDRFLVGGSASSATGGAAAMAHTHLVAGTSDANTGQQNYSSAGTSSSGLHTHTYSATSAAASNDENRPPFYTVVWIMRVK